MPGELFITMAKEGSTIGGLMDSLGTAVSVALQYGVPVQSLVNKFTHQRFEPAGMTANKDIPFAKSLVDYIFRWLGMQFIPGYREANLPQPVRRLLEAHGDPRTLLRSRPPLHGGRQTPRPTRSRRVRLPGDNRWSTSEQASPPRATEARRTRDRSGVSGS